MDPSPRGPRTAAALLATALLTTAGCQWLGSDEDDQVEDIDIGTLDALFEENNRLVDEIVDIQGRLIQNCLEEAGHSVHDESSFVKWNFQKRPMPDVDSGALPWLIDREIAKTWGYGIWATSDEMYGSPEHLEFEELMFGEGLSFATVDATAFQELSDAEQFAWHVDYVGEPQARLDYAHLLGDDDTMGPGGLIGSVEPEGCMGEVTEAFGLEPEFVPAPEFGEDAGTWSTFPVPPGLDTLSSGALDEEVRAARGGEEEFLDCLEEADRGRWDFNQGGDLNVRRYIEQAYGWAIDPMFPEPEEFTVGVPDELPTDDLAVPAEPDIPEDFEPRRQWESALALDLLDCAEESGLDDGARQAWANAYGAELLDREAETVAWQEEMRSLITVGQDLLAAG
ncbi:hypothetical protein AB0B28_10165 [Glycomyces sp. NPDC046736]|uniref:hypothetical protein n=1 Tax=Glycomyces sp. NPDC046736 TaxID=3155615 RepID=UPI0033D6DB4F